MEGVPRIPMISYPMRRSADAPNFRHKLKNFIASHYNESADSYTQEIGELESLRASATHVSKDLTGCSTLKKYFCQLNFLKSRFPMHEGSPVAVTFSWYDIYSETVHGWADIDFEMSCVLYNIGALHTELGTQEARQTPEGMKVACTHFQCAAWAFQHLRHNYPKFFTPDLSPDLLSVIYNICLGQAQECILEKSLIDNRKSTITAKVALQIVEYYQLALQTCDQMLKDSTQYSDKFTKPVKKWKKLVELKISYYSSMGFLYRGFQSEDQQKWGERITFFKAAKDKLDAAFKVAKTMEKTDSVHDTLSFTLDVIVGKLTTSEKDNEFIYHDRVPELDTIASDIKGVSLVKAIPFKFDDPAIAGPDIFGRLVPIEAHEASSLYSEEKAKLLRTYSAKIEEKNEALDKFLIALQLDQLDLHSDEMKIPQELVDCCAGLSVNKDVVKILSEKMSNLSGRFHDVESNLNEVLQLLQEEDAKEKEYLELLGKKTGSSNVLTELSREAIKYQAAQKRAAESNETLHEAMKAHVANMNILIKPLDEVLKFLPSAANIEQKDEEAIFEMKRLACKVDEMRKQRQALETQLRDSIHSDDITKQLVVKKDQDLETIFAEELKKHEKFSKILDQNLLAQENVMRALSEANARYAETRMATVGVIRHRNQVIQSLLSSYEAYDELITKCDKGIQFYSNLDENVGKLLARVRSVCSVQNEEREAAKKVFLKAPVPHVPIPVPAAFATPSLSDPYGNMGMGGMELSPGGTSKLKDYLSRRKQGQTDNTGQHQQQQQQYSAQAQYQQYYQQQNGSHLYHPTTATSSTSQYNGQSQGQGQYVVASVSTAGNAPSASAYGQNQQYYPQYPSGAAVASQYGNTSTSHSHYGSTSTYGSTVASVPQNQTPSQYVTAGNQSGIPGQNTAAVSATTATPAAAAVYSAHQYPSASHNSNPTSQYAHAPSPQYPAAPQSQYSSQGQGQGQSPYVASTAAAATAAYGQSQPYYAYSGASAPPAPTAAVPYSQYYPQQQQQQPVVASTHGYTLAQAHTQPQVTNSAMSTPTPTTQVYAQPQHQHQFTNANSAATPTATPYSQYYPQQPQSVSVVATTTTITQPQQPQIANTGTDSGLIEKGKYWTIYDKPTTAYGSQAQVGVSPGYGQYSYYGQGQQSGAGYGTAATTATAAATTYPQGYASQAQQPTATSAYAQQQQPQQQVAAPYAVNQTSTYSPTPATQVPQQQQQYGNQYTYPQQQPQPQQQQMYHQQQQQTPQGNYNQNNATSPAPVQFSSKNLDLLADLDLSSTVVPLAPVICHNASSANSQQLTDQLSESTPVRDESPSPPQTPTPAPTHESVISVSAPVSSVQIPTIPFLNGTNAKKTVTKVDPLDDPSVLSKFSLEVEKLNHLIESFHKKSLIGPTNMDLKWRELLDIQNAESIKRNISVARCYPMKNRFPDILPYDHSRVPLPTTRDDYINASFLNDLSSSAIPFIATQAPLPTTYEDFWHMVWHYSVELIVCLLTDGDLKGHIYWPTEKGNGNDAEFGPFKIALQTCNPKQTFIERIFTVTHRDLKQKRVVIHLQFKEWVGNVFPVSPAYLLGFVNEVHSFHEQQRNQKRPVVVHCTAGVGKTGVFCTLSSALKELSANGGNPLVDLVQTAGKACEQRKGIMIDKEYLRFTYHCLLYYCQDLLMKRGILSTTGTTFDKKPKVHAHTRHPSQDFLTDLTFKKLSADFLNPNDGSSDSAKELTNSTSSGESSRRSSINSSPIRVIKKPSFYSDVPSSLTNLDVGTFKLKEKQKTTVEIREAFESGKGALLDPKEKEEDPKDPLSSLDPLWTIKK